MQQGNTNCGLGSLTPKRSAHPQAEARILEEEADRRTAEVDTGTRISPREADRHTAEEEADTRRPAQEVDRHTAEEELGRSIPAEVVDNRDRVVEAYSTSWPTGTSALLAVSERSSRTRLTRFEGRAKDG